MHFPAARADVVRAINQRWLLKFWKRQEDTHRLPRWQAIEAEDLSRVAANLSFLDVSGSDGTARFLIRFHGEAIAPAYGSADCRGKFLDEIIPAADRAAGLAPYHETIQTGRPVYTLHDVTDRGGRLVYCERLLLPFARDGKGVDRILAAFEFVCPDGAFDSRGLMKTPAAPARLRLCATIEPQATV